MIPSFLERTEWDISKGEEPIATIVGHNYSVPWGKFWALIESYWMDMTLVLMVLNPLKYHKMNIELLATEGEGHIHIFDDTGKHDVTFTARRRDT